MDNKKKLHWYTPSELLDMYPKLRAIYTPQLIGYLALGKGVNHKKIGRMSLIEFEDFQDFLARRFGITLE